MRYLILFALAVVCHPEMKAQGNLPGYRLEGSISLATPVSGTKMTNLIFPAAVASAVKVSPDVKMYRPRGVRNVIELKAVRRNFSPTNITVYGVNGVEYSFALHYVDDTSVLDFRVVGDAPVKGGGGGSDGFRDSGGFGDNRDYPVMLAGMPVAWTKLDSDAIKLEGRRPFLKGSVSSGGVCLQLNGIYLSDSLLWLALKLRNRVGIGFTPSYMRIYMEDGKEVKRTAIQQEPIGPVFPARLTTLPGRSKEEFAIGFNPVVPGRRKRLVVELSDTGGDRVLVLRMKAKTVLKAREVQL